MNERKLPLLTEVITHVRPHVDELFGIWLIDRHGRHTWHRRDNGPLRVRYAENDADAKAMAGAGTLLIGIGGGEFDEHKATGRDAKECAASLVAKRIRDREGRPLSGVLEISHILREVVKADKGEAKGYFGLPSLVNRMQRQKTDPRRVLEFAFQAFDACYAEAQDFFRTCDQVFEKAEVHETAGLCCAVVDTDVEAIGSFARTRRGVNVLFIRSPSTGNVALQLDDKAKARGILPPLVRAILREELVRAGRAEAYADAALAVDGIEQGGGGRDLPGAPHWFYHVEQHMLLNGSKSKPGAVPTALTTFDFIRLFIEAAESSEGQGQGATPTRASA